MKSLLRSTRVRAALPVAAALSLAAQGAPAQQQDDGEWLEQCRRNWNGRGENHCEVREVRLRPGGTLRVDGRENGGVHVRGWDRDEVLVRARVQAHAGSAADARRIASGIRVESGGGSVRATGPETSRDQHWAVSYEVFVPRRADLDLDTHNGPIDVRDVSGALELSAHNGPLTLRNVGGTVRGRTVNGPLNVELSGSAWSGAGLDVQTTNGPVNLAIPAGYNAHLETGNTHGPVNVDFPVTVQGRTHRISTDLGRGGPTIRAITTNGPVNVRRAGERRSRR